MCSSQSLGGQNYGFEASVKIVLLCDIPNMMTSLPSDVIICATSLASDDITSECHLGPLSWRAPSKALLVQQDNLETLFACSHLLMLGLLGHGTKAMKLNL